MKKIIYFLLVPFCSFAQYQWQPLETNIGTSAGLTTLESIIFNSKLYFLASGSSVSGIGEELYSTDGTVAGTSLVQNLTPTFGQSSAIRDLRIFNNEIFFTAVTPETGRELYKCNGTTITLVKEIRLGSADSRVQSMVEINGLLYFFAEDALNVGLDLWRTDGTVNGTIKVQELDRDVFNPQHLMAKLDHYIIYVAESFNNPVGRELYSFNTLTNEIIQLFDTPNNPNGTIFYSSLTNFDNKLFFVVGNKLYHTDGQTSVMVSSPTAIQTMSNFTVFNNQLIFIASSSNFGTHDIYRCQKVSGEYTITLVYDFSPGAANLGLPFFSIDPDLLKFVPFNNKLYFAASEQLISGNNGLYKIYETDGLTAQVIIPIVHATLPSRPIFNITPWNNDLYFQMANNDGQGAIWKANPATGSYTVIDNANSGPIASIPTNVASQRPMVLWQNNLYMTARNFATNSELFKLSNTNLSLATSNSQKKYKIFPNPAVKDFIIDNASNNNLAVKMYNSIGQEVAFQKIQDQHYDIRNLANGIYIVSVHDLDSGNVATHKLIKN